MARGSCQPKLVPGRVPAKAPQQTIRCRFLRVTHKRVLDRFFRLQVTLSRDAHYRLRRAQDLLRHAVPNDDPAEIVDRALRCLLKELKRTRFYAAYTPRKAAGGGRSSSRHVPAAVRREVWQRDQGRCAFVGVEGRCTERGFLEFHHVEPFAAGGAATSEKIELRCRAHNGYEARLFFGRNGPALVREAPAEWG